jgi:sulfhydrogenase subunit gamma (sulfur reductase)
MKIKAVKYRGPEENPYFPLLATITNLYSETPNIKSFHVVLNDEGQRRNFCFEPGQVAQLSLFGVGESTFVINSSPAQKEYLQFSIMKVGEVTSAFHEISVGAQVGLRGPLGNHFPYSEMEGKRIVLIGGGLGLAPLRPLLLYMLTQREKYADIKLIYGARSPDDLCYKEDLATWKRAAKGIKVILTIDREAPGWEYKVGFVPAVVAQEAPSPENSVAITCGPPIMIKFVLVELEKLGFAPKQIYTTLERRMKCGLGLCGRCNIGPKYVCIDGPVFSLAQLKELPNEL